MRGIEGLQHSQMRGGQIVNVDEVAHTRSIRRRIIGSKDGYCAGRAERGTQHIGDKVRFWLVMFTVPVPSSGGVKVAQHCVTQSVYSVKPLQHNFCLQF